MNNGTTTTAQHEPWPHLWRMVVVGLCTLILCSCRGPRTAPWMAGGAEGLPTEAYTAAPQGQPPCPGHEMVSTAGLTPDGLAVDPGFAASGLVVPPPVRGPWMPPGLNEPWPEDEYLLDGGDRDMPASVTKDWEVHGVETEDTIAHFDTITGETIVRPSNQVRIYAPRFGAVRQVVSVNANEQWNSPNGMYGPTRLVHCEETDAPVQSKQNLQPNREISTKMASTFRSELLKDVVSQGMGPQSFQDAFLAYENLQIIRMGQYDMAEAPFLAKGIDAAVSWDHKQAVQIILEHQGAMEVESDQKAESVFTVNSPPGNPKLRVIKVASTQFAEPGDTVDFTIRFDNVGNEPIGNVTIIDNLTTRLEYIPDSAQCSLAGKFSTQPNEGQSLALRWEINDPLRVGKGGIIRFRCLVR